MMQKETSISLNKTSPAADFGANRGESELFRNNDTNIFIQTSFQCKLSIGSVNDPLEHEADTIADKVMSMQGVQPFVTASAGNIQRKCADCEEKEKLQRKPLVSFIQRKESSVGTVASDTVSNQINASKGSGFNMDDNTQSFMQSRFGADFSNVKIHTGGEAIQMNRELNAKAFTLGNEIYFNENHYHQDLKKKTHK